MAKKKARQPDDPEQSQRFKETAKEVGADDNGKALTRKINEPKGVIRYI
jgi:hypothetical protein